MGYEWSYTRSFLSQLHSSVENTNSQRRNLPATFKELQLKKRKRDEAFENEDRYGILCSNSSRKHNSDLKGNANTDKDMSNNLTMQKNYILILNVVKQLENGVFDKVLRDNLHLFLSLGNLELSSVLKEGISFENVREEVLIKIMWYLIDSTESFRVSSVIIFTKCISLSWLVKCQVATRELQDVILRFGTNLQLIFIEGIAVPLLRETGLKHGMGNLIAEVLVRYDSDRTNQFILNWTMHESFSTRPKCLDVEVAVITKVLTANGSHVTTRGVGLLIELLVKVHEHNLESKKYGMLIVSVVKTFKKGITLDQLNALLGVANKLKTFFKQTASSVINNELKKLENKCA